MLGSGSTRPFLVTPLFKLPGHGPVKPVLSSQSKMRLGALSDGWSLNAEGSIAESYKKSFLH